MSNAFCTARRPLALETATGLAAQPLVGGSARGGRIGNGMSRAWVAATPTAVEATNARRDMRSDMGLAPGRCERALRLRRRLSAVNLLPPGGSPNVPTVDFADPPSL